MAARRNNPYLQQRTVAVRIATLLLSCMLLTTAVREIIGESRMPCPLLYTAYFVTWAVGICTVAIRMLRLWIMQRQQLRLQALLTATLAGGSSGPSAIAGSQLEYSALALMKPPEASLGGMLSPLSEEGSSLDSGSRRNLSTSGTPVPGGESVLGMQRVMSQEEPDGSPGGIPHTASSSADAGADGDAAHDASADGGESAATPGSQEVKQRRPSGASSAAGSEVARADASAAAKASAGPSAALLPPPSGSGSKIAPTGTLPPPPSPRSSALPAKAQRSFFLARWLCSCSWFAPSPPRSLEEVAVPITWIERASDRWRLFTPRGHFTASIMLGLPGPIAVAVRAIFVPSCRAGNYGCALMAGDLIFMFALAVLWMPLLTWLLWATRRLHDKHMLRRENIAEMGALSVVVTAFFVGQLDFTWRATTFNSEILVCYLVASTACITCIWPVVSSFSPEWGSGGWARRPSHSARVYPAPLPLDGASGAAAAGAGSGIAMPGGATIGLQQLLAGQAEAARLAAALRRNDPNNLSFRGGDGAIGSLDSTGFGRAGDAIGAAAAAAWGAPTGRTLPHLSSAGSAGAFATSGTNAAIGLARSRTTTTSGALSLDTLAANSSFRVVKNGLSQTAGGVALAGSVVVAGSSAEEVAIPMSMSAPLQAPTGSAASGSARGSPLGSAAADVGGSAAVGRPTVSAGATQTVSRAGTAAGNATSASAAASAGVSVGVATIGSAASGSSRAGKATGTSDTAAGSADGASAPGTSRRGSFLSSVSMTLKRVLGFGGTGAGAASGAADPAATFAGSKSAGAGPTGKLKAGVPGSAAGGSAAGSASGTAQTWRRQPHASPAAPWMASANNDSFIGGGGAGGALGSVGGGGGDDSIADSWFFDGPGAAGAAAAGTHRRGSKAAVPGGPPGPAGIDDEGDGSGIGIVAGPVDGFLDLCAVQRSAAAASQALLGPSGLHRVGTGVGAAPSSARGPAAAAAAGHGHASRGGRPSRRDSAGGLLAAAGTLAGGNSAAAALFVAAAGPFEIALISAAALGGAGFAGGSGSGSGTLLEGPRPPSSSARIPRSSAGALFTSAFGSAGAGGGGGVMVAPGSPAGAASSLGIGLGLGSLGSSLVCACPLLQLGFGGRHRCGKGMECGFHGSGQHKHTSACSDDCGSAPSSPVVSLSSSSSSAPFCICDLASALLFVLGAHVVPTAAAALPAATAADGAGSNSAAPNTASVTAAAGSSSLPRARSGGHGLIGGAGSGGPGLGGASHLSLPPLVEGTSAASRPGSAATVAPTAPAAAAFAGDHGNGSGLGVGQGQGDGGDVSARTVPTTMAAVATGGTAAGGGGGSAWFSRDTSAPATHSGLYASGAAQGGSLEHASRGVSSSSGLGHGAATTTSSGKTAGTGGSSTARADAASAPAADSTAAAKASRARGRSSKARVKLASDPLSSLTDAARPDSASVAASALAAAFAAANERNVRLRRAVLLLAPLLDPLCALYVSSDVLGNEESLSGLARAAAGALQQRPAHAHHGLRSTPSAVAIGTGAATTTGSSSGSSSRGTASGSASHTLVTHASSTRMGASMTAAGGGGTTLVTAHSFAVPPSAGSPSVGSPMLSSTAHTHTATGAPASIINRPPAGSIASSLPALTGGAASSTGTGAVADSSHTGHSDKSATAAAAGGSSSQAVPSPHGAVHDAAGGHVVPAAAGSGAGPSPTAPRSLLAAVGAGFRSSVGRFLQLQPTPSGPASPSGQPPVSVGRRGSQERGRSSTGGSSVVGAGHAAGASNSSSPVRLMPSPAGGGRSSVSPAHAQPLLSQSPGSQATTPLGSDVPPAFPAGAAFALSLPLPSSGNNNSGSVSSAPSPASSALHSRSPSSAAHVSGPSGSQAIIAGGASSARSGERFVSPASATAAGAAAMSPATATAAGTAGPSNRSAPLPPARSRDSRSGHPSDSRAASGHGHQGQAAGQAAAAANSNTAVIVVTELNAATLGGSGSGFYRALAAAPDLVVDQGDVAAAMAPSGLGGITSAGAANGVGNGATTAAGGAGDKERSVGSDKSGGWPPLAVHGGGTASDAGLIHNVNSSASSPGKRFSIDSGAAAAAGGSYRASGPSKASSTPSNESAAGVFNVNAKWQQSVAGAGAVDTRASIGAAAEAVPLLVGAAAVSQQQQQQQQAGSEHLARSRSPSPTQMQGAAAVSGSSRSGDANAAGVAAIRAPAASPAVHSGRTSLSLTTARLAPSARQLLADENANAAAGGPTGAVATSSSAVVSPAGSGAVTGASAATGSSGSSAAIAGAGAAAAGGSGGGGGSSSARSRPAASGLSLRRVIMGGGSDAQPATSTAAVAAARGPSLSAGTGHSAAHTALVFASPAGLNIGVNARTFAAFGPAFVVRGCTGLRAGASAAAAALSPGAAAAGAMFFASAASPAGHGAAAALLSPAGLMQARSRSASGAGAAAASAAAAETAMLSTGRGSSSVYGFAHGYAAVAAARASAEGSLTIARPLAASADAGSSSFFGLGLASAALEALMAQLPQSAPEERTAVLTQAALGLLPAAPLALLLQAHLLSVGAVNTVETAAATAASLLAGMTSRLAGGGRTASVGALPASAYTGPGSPIGMALSSLPVARLADAVAAAAGGGTGTAAAGAGSLSLPFAAASSPRHTTGVAQAAAPGLGLSIGPLLGDPTGAATGSTGGSGGSSPTVASPAVAAAASTATASAGAGLAIVVSPPQPLDVSEAALLAVLQHGSTSSANAAAAATISATVPPAVIVAAAARLPLVAWHLIYAARGRRYIRAALLSEFALENLLFLLEVMQLRQALVQAASAAFEELLAVRVRARAMKAAEAAAAAAAAAAASAAALVAAGSGSFDGVNALISAGRLAPLTLTSPAAHSGGPGSGPGFPLMSSPPGPFTGDRESFSASPAQASVGGGSDSRSVTGSVNHVPTATDSRTPTELAAGALPLARIRAPGQGQGRRSSADQPTRSGGPATVSAVSATTSANSAGQVLAGVAAAFGSGSVASARSATAGNAGAGESSNSILGRMQTYPSDTGAIGVIASPVAPVATADRAGQVAALNGFGGQPQQVDSPIAGQGADADVDADVDVDAAASRTHSASPTSATTRTHSNAGAMTAASAAERATESPISAAPGSDGGTASPGFGPDDVGRAAHVPTDSKMLGAMLGADAAAAAGAPGGARRDSPATAAELQRAIRSASGTDAPNSSSWPTVATAATAATAASATDWSPHGHSQAGLGKARLSGIGAGASALVDAASGALTAAVQGRNSSVETSVGRGSSSPAVAAAAAVAAALAATSAAAAAAAAVAALPPLPRSRAYVMASHALRIAEDVCSRYLRDGSRTQINVSDRLRRGVLEAARAGIEAAQTVDGGDRCLWGDLLRAGPATEAALRMLASLPWHLFAPAEREIFALLVDGPVRRFLASKAFGEWRAEVLAASAATREREKERERASVAAAATGIPLSALAPGASTRRPSGVGRSS